MLLEGLCHRVNLDLQVSKQTAAQGATISNTAVPQVRSTAACSAGCGAGHNEGLQPTTISS
jgi:hypothetical protein